MNGNSPNERVPGRRDPLFDLAKALMMLWVVWGHLGLYRIVAQEPDSPIWMANAKIGVNMPMFFVVGGYLAHSAFQNGTWSKIAVRIIRFIWPMASFGAFFGLVLVLCGKGNGIRWFLEFCLGRVLHGHWFLRTFAGVYLLSSFVFRTCRTNRGKWLGFSLLYVAMLFVPLGYQHCLYWIGGRETIHMFPYFAFGLLVLRTTPWWRSNMLSILSGIVFLSIVFLEGDSAENGMNFWNASTYWRAIFLDRHGLLCLIARTVVGITGSVFVLWTVDLALRLVPQLSTFAVFGTTSLGVYVLHEWPMEKLGNTGVAFLPFPEWTRWPVALAWFLACHLAISGIRKIHLFQLVFFGDEKWLYAIIGRLFPFSRRFASHDYEK